MRTVGRATPTRLQLLIQFILELLLELRVRLRRCFTGGRRALAVLVLLATAAKMTLCIYVTTVQRCRFRGSLPAASAFGSLERVIVDGVLV
jgi:hypothetical protein